MSDYSDLEFVEVEVAPVLAAQMAGACATDPAAIGKAFGTIFEKLGAFVQAAALTPAGPPRAIYTDYSPDGLKFVLALPVAGSPAGALPEGSECFVETLPGGKILRFTHHGPYPELMKTYGRVTEFMKAKGLMETEADWARYMPMWEEYMNDPETTPEADLVTHICLPTA